MIEFKKQYIVEIWKNIKNKITASMVKFSDGQTFQQKYDNGELKGDQGNPGKDGSPGTPGKDGVPGAKGEDGTSITSVQQTTTSSSDGGTNVIKVTLSDGSSSTFQVKNGSKGSAGANGTNRY